MAIFYDETVRKPAILTYVIKLKEVLLAAMRREASNLLTDTATTDDERTMEVEEMQPETEGAYVSQV